MRPEVPSRWQAHGLVDPPPRYRRFARLFGLRVQPDDADVRALRDGLTRTDEVADDFVRWSSTAGPGVGRALFERAVEGGLAAVPDAPPELVRWFEPLERTPPWLDRDALRLAARTAFRTGDAGGGVLTAVALMGGYRSQAAVKPLAMTGALDRMVVRRIGETSRFVMDVYETIADGRGSLGVKSACRVRLMHALVRRSLARRPDWDAAAWGAPINQTDTAATHLEFCAVYLTGLSALGFRFDRDEREAVMHLWRYVAGLMGADDALLAHTFADGLRHMYIHAVTNPPADEDSRALARALHGLPVRIAEGPLGRARARVQTRLLTALSRLVLGDEAVDDIGLPPSHLAPALMLLSAGRFGVETVRRAVPGATERAARRGRAAQRRGVDAMVGAERVRYVPYADRAPRGAGARSTAAAQTP